MSKLELKPLATGAVAIAAISAAFAGAPAALAHLAPPPGRAGECFAEVMHRPTYRTVTETVAGAPIVSYRTIPAVYGHGEKQVVATPARVDRQVIPATYRTIPRWTVIPGRTVWIRSQPVYRTVTEQTVITPAHLEWRYGAEGAVQDAFGAVRSTGRVLCRVLVPARYGLFSHEVMVSAGESHAVIGPGRRVICYVRVLATPARVIEHKVPATYRTVQTTYIVKPATHERVVTPGPTRQIQRQVIATPAHRGWSKLHCSEVRHEDGERG
jgi:hypothetical protein